MIQWFGNEHGLIAPGLWCQPWSAGLLEVPVGTTWYGLFKIVSMCNGPVKWPLAMSWIIQLGIAWLMNASFSFTSHQCRMSEFVMIYPLVICYIAMESGPRIDGSPFLKMVDLSTANCEFHNQMVSQNREKTQPTGEASCSSHCSMARNFAVCPHVLNCFDLDKPWQTYVLWGPRPRYVNVGLDSPQ